MVATFLQLLRYESVLTQFQKKRKAITTFLNQVAATFLIYFYSFHLYNKLRTFLYYSCALYIHQPNSF